VYRCPRCTLDCETEENLGEHLTGPQCDKREMDGPPTEVPPFKWQKVKEILNKNTRGNYKDLSNKDRYQALWEVLFPSEPPPQSPCK
jgi:hypothetical protein